LSNLVVSRQNMRLLFVLGLLGAMVACTSRPQQGVMQDYKAPETAVKPVPAPVVSGIAKTSAPATSGTVPSAAAKPETRAAKPDLKPVAVVKTKTVVTKTVEKPVEPAKPVAPPPKSGDVLGLGPIKVTDLLGEPGLIRREKPAEVWQYAGKDCVLHVFLYDDEPSGTFRVDHLEATDLEGAETSTDICLTGLIGQ
jgi:hypothetical protein